MAQVCQTQWHCARVQVNTYMMPQAVCGHVCASVCAQTVYSAATAHLGAVHSLLALGIQPLVPQAAAILVWVAALPQHLCQVAAPTFHLRTSCLGFPCMSPYIPDSTAASVKVRCGDVV